MSNSCCPSSDLHWQVGSKRISKQVAYPERITCLGVSKLTDGGYGLEEFCTCPEVLIVLVILKYKFSDILLIW